MNKFLSKIKPDHLLKFGFVALLLSLSLLIPDLSFAQEATMESGMKAQIDVIVPQLVAIAIALIAIVGAIIGAKLMFSLFKKA